MQVCVLLHLLLDDLQSLGLLAFLSLVHLDFLDEVVIRQQGFVDGQLLLLVPLSCLVVLF
jgi:hypothetical protein